VLVDFRIAQNSVLCRAIRSSGLLFGLAPSLLVSKLGSDLTVSTEPVDVELE
jgi:hypothetical protein